MNNRQEITISFSEILYGILRHWRTLIIVTVVFALLAGAYSYMKSGKGSTASSGKDYTDLSALAPEERDAVLDAVALKEMYADMLAEYDASYITALDNNKVKTTTVNYYVKAVVGADDYDYTTDLCIAYMAAGIGNAVREKYAASAGAMLTAEELGDLILASYEGRTVTFTIYTAAEDHESELIVEAIQSVLQSSQKDFAETVGAHSLELVTVESVIGHDANVTSLKNARKSALDLAKTNAGNAYDRTDSALHPYVDAVLKSAKDEEEHHSGRTISKKLLVAGAAAGFVLAIVIAICRYVWSSRIQNYPELEQVFGLNVYGKLSAADEKKGSARLGIDRAIMKKQYRMTDTISGDDAVCFAAERVANALKEDEENSVAYVSTNLSLVQTTAGKLAKETENLKIRTEILDVKDIYHHLDTLRDAGNIILVERMGSTNRNVLTDLMLLCEEQNICVDGIITLI